MLPQLTTLLYLSGDPIEPKKLATLLHITEDQVIGLLPELQKGLGSIGLDVLIGTEGISIVTQVAHAPLVEAFWKKELEGDLTPAALQVLTLVAYLGNPTREEISYIRGVQSSLSIRTLTVKGLITRSGEVCSLTTEALKSLGITKVTELPEYESLHASLRGKLAEHTS